MDLFWTMLWLFLFFAWIWLLITVFSDIFRSDDLGGWGKALWILFTVFLPYLGVLVYLIARGGSMQQRTLAEHAAREEMTRAYVQQVARSGSTAEELTQLANLRDTGVITAEEFNQQKAKL
ncbi:MAG TPA: SHOCT domain-containing protein, partial [Acidimicrobiia bacterium]